MTKPATATLPGDERRRLESYIRRRLDTPRVAERVIRPRSATSPAPLSFEQELIWIHSRLAPDLPIYNEILTVRRSGRLDVTILERALDEITRRHEAWRTTFVEMDDRPVQIVHPPTHFSLPVSDLSALPPSEREREACRLATEEARRPIDVERGPLVRAKLVRLADDEYRLYVVLHQIVHDGISVYSVFLPELAALYESFAAGHASSLSRIDVQYSDYAAWQRDVSRAPVASESLDYWRRQLAGASLGLELPTDGARPTVQSFRGGQHVFTLSKPLTDALKRLSQREEATLFATLMSAFKILLHRFSGQEDIAVGTAISTRQHTDVERLLGVFLNTIVVRTQVAESLTFRQVLANVRRTIVEGLSHGDVPFHVLVRELEPERDPGRNPFFQVTFVLEPPMPSPRPGWSMTQMDVDTGISRVDLYLQMDDRPEGLVGHIRYSSDLWQPATIAHLAEHFELLLHGITTDPEQVISAIPILTAADRAVDCQDASQLRRNSVELILGNHGGVPSSKFVPFDARALESSIPGRFAEQVAKRPARIAVRDGKNVWTYTELDRAANKVAHALVESGVAVGDRVALLLDHAVPTVAGVLGVLKIGATYVPLDPTHPEERLRLIVADAGASAVVCSRRNTTLARELLSNSVAVLELDGVLRGPAAPEYGGAASRGQVAYLLYTSGSTGKPKGVAQSHRNVLHFIAAYTNRLCLSSEDRLTLLASYSVDAAVMDLFGALLNGAELCLIDVRDAGLHGVRDRLTGDGVTVYHSTPTLFRHVARELRGYATPATVRLVVLGGEEVRSDDVATFRDAFARHCILVNGYGPTESTVSLQYVVDRRTDPERRSIPVGRPVERTAVTLLSREGRPNQIYGEIAIKSPHVALGYWQSPELTSAVFLPDPAGGADVLYKTGDMGRLLPDGNVEYLGRRDLQTKVHGFRVEIGEVEAALSRHSSVKEAAAAVWESREGEKRLIAHVVFDERPGPSHDELRRFLRRSLPVYMVPSAFVVHDALPLTPSGKIDRLSLPVPDMTRAEREPTAPSDVVERLLTEIWKRALGVEHVALRDDFFGLGGHSLLALRMMTEIHRELGVNLPLSALFEAPTIEDLADLIRSTARYEPSPAITEDPMPRRLLARLFARWMARP